MGQPRCRLEAWLQVDANDNEGRQMLAESYYEAGELLLRRDRWDEAERFLASVFKVSADYRITQSVLVARYPRDSSTHLAAVTEHPKWAFRHRQRYCLAP